MLNLLDILPVQRPASFNCCAKDRRAASEVDEIFFTKTSKAISPLVADPLDCVAGLAIARAASGPE